MRLPRTNEGNWLAKAAQGLKTGTRSNWNIGRTAVAQTDFTAEVLVKRGPQQRVKVAQVVSANR